MAQWKSSQHSGKNTERIRATTAKRQIFSRWRQYSAINNGNEEGGSPPSITHRIDTSI